MEWLGAVVAGVLARSGELSADLFPLAGGSGVATGFGATDGSGVSTGFGATDGSGLVGAFDVDGGEGAVLVGCPSAGLTESTRSLER